MFVYFTSVLPNNLSRLPGKEACCNIETSCKTNECQYKINMNLIYEPVVSDLNHYAGINIKK